MRVFDEIAFGKKRERSGDDLKSLDSVQCHKRILCEGLNSLCLREESTHSDQLKSHDDIVNSGCCDLLDNDTMEESCESDLCVDLNGHLEAQSENLLSMLKSGTRKYGRRVDYLVDELIRKSQKRHCSTLMDDFYVEDIIPNSVGPHPLTDRPLGKLWPTVVPTVEGAAMLTRGDYQSGHVFPKSPRPSITPFSSVSESCRMDDGSVPLPGGQSDIDSSEKSNEYQMHGHAIAPINLNISSSGKNKSYKSCQPAGTVTHSEWGIVDVINHECAS